MNKNPIPDCDEALPRLLAAARRVKGVDHVPPAEALGRVLAEPVVSAADGMSGAEVLAAGMVLTAPALDLAAPLGLATLPVRRRLSVALLSAGNQLAAPGQPLLLSPLTQLGCTVEDMGQLPETLDAARRTLRKAGALHDMVIVTGISAGDTKRVESAVEAEGEIKLGQPLAFGKVDSADFFGLADNPLAALETFDRLVRPFIVACQGATARATT